MLSAVNEDFRMKFPLHSLVWENDYRNLENESTKVCQHMDTELATTTHLFLATSLSASKWLKPALATWLTSC